MGPVTADNAIADEIEMDGADELPLCHEMTTLGELRALSDPLRVTLYRLLREREHTVRELCVELGESSTRLYYHVGALERVGLVRLVRTDARAGTIQKYYRAVARYVRMPAWLLHEELSNPHLRAAGDWYAAMIEHAAEDVRALFGEHLRAADREAIFFTRNFVRLSPERAREFSRRIENLQADLLAADDEQGETRFAFTTAFVPVVWNGREATQRPVHRHDRRRARAVHEHEAEPSGAAGHE